MAGYRRWIVSAAVLLLLSACGDDSGASDDESGQPSGDDSAQPDADTDTDTPSPDTGSSDGGGSAIITSGDSTILFSMDDVTFSQIEGIEDVTFETCDPSFFGAAFHAIGYPVDEAGELELGDDGAPAGIIALTLPLDAAGEATAGPAEFDLDYSPLGFDLKIASDEQLASMATDVEPSWSFDGNRVRGTVVMGNVLSEPTVLEFDVSCS